MNLARFNNLFMSCVRQLRLKINEIQFKSLCPSPQCSGADPCSTLGIGIIPHFYRFFGILKFWGGYLGFADF